MASFNKVLLLGNLTRDPEMRYIPSTNQPVVEFGLACNRRFKTANGEDREEVTFVDITAFGRSAEIINQYCRKGKQLFVEGRLKYDTWEDKQGGGKRSKLRVIVENFQLLGGREGAGAPGHDGGPPPSGDDYDQRPRASARPPAGKPMAQQRPQSDQAPPISEEEHFKEDDIPF
jgi:single-strand DNA-binding protein